MRKYEVLLGVALTVALVGSVGPVAHAQSMGRSHLKSLLIVDRLLHEKW